MSIHTLKAYHYELQEELIAQYPCTPRDRSRLMIVERSTGKISEMVFQELYDFLDKGDSLVFNDTKVIPARLMGKRESGGGAEVFLTKRLTKDTWEALTRPAKKLGEGSIVQFGESFSCKIIEVLPGGLRKIQFQYDGDFEKHLAHFGKIPLPHYIRREPEIVVDSERYQTIFASQPGAVAAPTAGLHFTQELLDRFTAKEVNQTYLTLHVGLGTFLPVQTEDIRDHHMHSETFVINSETSKQLNVRQDGKRQICVGTTCCRALESAMQNGNFEPGEYETDIFIYPGYKFKYVQSLLTNFHLPGSTLLMLVSAFGGYDLIMEAYAKAVKERYRFYSYGDAMLIL